MTTRLTTFKIDRSELTSEGYLKAKAIATRVGVFPYVLPDGSVRKELRPASEVFLPASMETLKGKPVTDNHPDAPVTAANAKELSRGWTHDDVCQEDTLLCCTVTIMDAALVQAIQNGKQEVSCGYTCDLDPIPGKYQGEDYDAVQKNISYNHLAVVPRGRAGPEVRIRLDAAEEIFENAQPKENRMSAKVRLGKQGIEVEVADASVASAIADKIRKDEMSMEEMTAAITALQAKVEALEGAKAALAGELENKDAELKKAEEGMSEEKMDALLDARVKVKEVAAKVLEAGKVKLDGLKTSEIKRLVVAERMPALKLDGKSADFIEGCFNAISESLASQSTKGTSQPGFNNPPDGNRNDGAPVDSIAARARAMDRDANAWKRK